jgi:hypothetical protein
MICCPKNRAKMQAGTMKTAKGYSLFAPSFFDKFKISNIIDPKTEDKIIVKIVLVAPSSNPETAISLTSPNPRPSFFFMKRYE